MSTRRAGNPVGQLNSRVLNQKCCTVFCHIIKNIAITVMMFYRPSLGTCYRKEKKSQEEKTPDIVSTPVTSHLTTRMLHLNDQNERCTSLMRHLTLMFMKKSKPFPPLKHISLKILETGKCVILIILSFNYWIISGSFKC